MEDYSVVSNGIPIEGFAEDAYGVIMRKEKEAVINGTKFKVTQLCFADGADLLTSLGRIIGPALSDEHKVKSSAAMIGDIINQLSLSEISFIADKLARSTRI